MQLLEINIVSPRHYAAALVIIRYHVLCVSTFTREKYRNLNQSQNYLIFTYFLLSCFLRLKGEKNKLLKIKTAIYDFPCSPCKNSLVYVTLQPGIVGKPVQITNHLLNQPYDKEGPTSPCHVLAQIYSQSHKGCHKCVMSGVQLR